MNSEAVLTGMLEIAVPLWIERLRPLNDEQRRERAQACSDVIGEHGDVILYKSKKEGETAEAFNRLAEGVACAAFAPGGITVFGNHWEVDQDG